MCDSSLDILRALDPGPNVAAVAARLGHLVEPNGVVHAVGPKLAIVHLATTSGHLDVLLAVNAEARKRGVHRSGGQR